MGYNVGVEKAKVLFEPLLPMSEMRCTLTRFYWCNLAAHCPLAPESPLNGMFVHVVRNTKFSI